MFPQSSLPLVVNITFDNSSLYFCFGWCLCLATEDIINLGYICSPVIEDFFLFPVLLLLAVLVIFVVTTYSSFWELSNPVKRNLSLLVASVS